jgi:hypothetical protein
MSKQTPYRVRREMLVIVKESAFNNLFFFAILCFPAIARRRRSLWGQDEGYHKYSSSVSARRK